ncbi:glycine C-acetyltransferase [Streptomyces hirsutus]
MASVRFICGTQEVHKELEARLSAFLGQEDTILYSSCFDANGGVFEELLLGAQDAVISDALNHASIIDGIRLSKARRFRYANRDMADLERQFKEAAEAGAAEADRHRRRLLHGRPRRTAGRDLRPCRPPRRHGHGRRLARRRLHGGGGGTPELHGVMDRVDILTGTLGKALGGASGGYVAARAEIVALLRQRSRPYLFSNTLAPVIAAASLKVLDLLESAGDLRVRLGENTALFRRRMTEEGFDILPGDHPIAPVMIGDASRAGRLAELLLERGVYVIGFSYPVVPRTGPDPRPAVRRALHRGREPRGGRLRGGTGGARRLSGA